jgi:hypothetical protein
LHSNGKRSARVKLRNADGRHIKISIAKLVALSFIPNPCNHPSVIFKDRNKNNFSKDNLQWVSRADFSRFISNSLWNADLLGTPVVKKEKPPVWIDPERVEIQDMPGYYISPSGLVYRGDQLIKPCYRKGRAPIVKFRIKDSPPSYRYFGLASLIATHFIPNPRQYRYIIFKDRNSQNCVEGNIAWVDAETFTYYCTGHKGGKKLVLDRENAIRKCADEHLKMYYKTLDEYWLHECWKKVEKTIMVKNWEAYRAECYLYFLDRAKRFSLLNNPTGMLVFHIRGLHQKLRNEISPDIPFAKLLRSDESLRKVGYATRCFADLEYY